jgi:hypothetical protein
MKEEGMAAKEKKKGFSWRGWTTFFVTLSFIIDTVSGIILYIAPPGRIANWTNWKIWGLSKGDWGAIHTIFGYVLLIIVGLHLYYNWKVFWNFIWSRLRKAMNLKLEMGLAILVSLFIFLGTIWNIPPFSSTMDLGEYLKASWEENKTDTPIAHAELLSLKAFAEKTNVPLEEMLDALKSKGYRVKDPEQTLGDIAKENNTSPSRLYEAAKSGGLKPDAPKTIQGSGMGRKTIEQICSEKGLSVEEALGRLRDKGIKAAPKDRLKEIAGEIGKTPMEVFSIMEGKE